MAKILIAVDNEFNNDVRVVREANLLAKEGHEIQVLCYISEKYIEAPIEGIKVSRINISKNKINKIKPLINTLPFFNNIWTREIQKEVEDFNPDYLLTHDLYMALPARKGLNKSGSSAKLVLDLHENYPDSILTYNWTKGWKSIVVQPKKWKSKEGKYLSLADRIIVLSEDFEKVLSKRYDSLKGKFTILPNVPDIEKFGTYSIKKIDTIKFSSPIMLYFGVIAERRGIFDSLDSFKRIVEEGVDINYLLIGPVDKADNDRFQSYLEDPVLKERLQYIKWITMDELPSYLQAVDFCIAPFKVNPQHESGIANKLFQYMYGKKPIIASNCKPQAELISAANNGIVFKSNSELDEAITRLADSKTDLLTMGENGYQVLHEKYHLDVVKRDFIEIFESA